MRERLDRIWPSLVALAGTVAVVFGLLTLFGGDDVDDSPPDTTADEPVDPVDTTTPPADPPTDPPTDAATEPPPTDPTDDPTDPPTDAPEDVREPVGIANQTSVAGLAAFAQQRLEDGGWEVPATSDFSGTVPETTVYYPEGMQEAAEALSAQFPEIGRVEPSFEGLNQSRLVVILVDDYPSEVDGAPE